MENKFKIVPQLLYFCSSHIFYIILVLLHGMKGLSAQPSSLKADLPQPQNLPLQNKNHMLFGMSRIQQAHEFDSSPFAEIRLKSSKWSNKTLIHMCAETGCYGVTEAILKENKEVNNKDKDQNTPLHLACFYNHPQVVKLLLMHKSDVKLRNKFYSTAIHSAAISGCLDCLILLFNHGANINDRGINGLTALHIAVINSDIPMIVLLLKMKTDKTLLDNSFKKPLYYAQTNAVRDLLEGIVDLNDVSHF